MKNVIEENLKEQNKLLKDALVFFYDHKLNNKTKNEIIAKTLNEVTNLERKLKIKLVKKHGIERTKKDD